MKKRNKQENVLFSQHKVLLHVWSYDFYEMGYFTE